MKLKKNLFKLCLVIALVLSFLSNEIIIGASTKENETRSFMNEFSLFIYDETRKELDYSIVKSIDNKRNIYTNTDILNIRKEPSTSSEIIMKVNNGTKLKAVKTLTTKKSNKNEKWIKVNTSKGIGYVNSDYIQTTNPIINLGRYYITYYCSCEKCCDVETGITASGTRVKEGRTIAADPSIPFGTKLIIDGHTYTVEDRGGMIKGNHIDIYVDGHERALYEFETRHTNVYMPINQ